MFSLSPPPLLCLCRRYLWMPYDFLATVESERVNHFFVTALPPEDSKGPVFPDEETAVMCGGLTFLEMNATPECNKHVVHRGVTPNVTELRKTVLLASQFVSTQSSDDRMVQ
jgi:hypothetical protein